MNEREGGTARLGGRAHAQLPRLERRLERLRLGVRFGESEGNENVDALEGRPVNKQRGKTPCMRRHLCMRGELP